MLTRIVHAIAAAGSAVIITTTSGSAGPADGSPPTINVDPNQAVFAGAVTVAATRPAERLEIVLAGSPQSDSAAFRGVTAALTALMRATLPSASVEPLPEPTKWSSLRVLAGLSVSPGVRISVPMPASDTAIRDRVSRTLAAVNTNRAIWARVISIDHIFAGCTPFDGRLRTAAHARLEELARALGTPSVTAPTLQRLRAPFPIEAPPGGMPHCTSGSAIFPDESLPSSSSYTDRGAFAGTIKDVRLAAYARVSYGR